MAVCDCRPRERTKAMPLPVSNFDSAFSGLRSRGGSSPHAEIRAILEEAQFLGGAQPSPVVCAGCGIALPARHFALDHVNPRAQDCENRITKRAPLRVFATAAKDTS